MGIFITAISEETLANAIECNYNPVVVAFRLEESYPSSTLYVVDYFRFL